MALPTTKSMCEYLFWGLKAPLHILGQDSCDVIKYRGPRNKLSNLKVKGTNKDLFVKPLDKLFDPTGSKFSSSNTIIVDDSREKHVLNEPEIVVLPILWSQHDVVDRFLVDELLPWIQRLHQCRGQGLLSFRREDNIGHRMLIEEPDTQEFDELMSAIENSRTLTEDQSSRR